MFVLLPLRDELMRVETRRLSALGDEFSSLALRGLLRPEMRMSLSRTPELVVILLRSRSLNMDVAAIPFASFSSGVAFRMELELLLVVVMG